MNKFMIYIALALAWLNPSLVNAQNSINSQVAISYPISQPGSPYNYGSLFPAAIANDLAGIDLGTITIDRSSDPALVTTSKSPCQVFSEFSQACSNPSTIFYVAATGGSDANSCLTTGLACNSCSHAIQLGNATNLPYQVSIKAGTYTRAQSCAGTGSAIVPTQDAYFQAYGGIARFTMQEATFTPAADGTYTNTYSVTLPAVDNDGQAFDVAGLFDQYGYYQRLRNLPTPAAVNTTPCSWTSVSTKFYFNRCDNAAVTASNTRMDVAYNNFCITNINSNVMLGSIDGSQFIFEGGSGACSVGAGGGGITVEAASAMTGPKKIVVISNTSVIGSFRGIAVESWNGYVITYNADVSITHNDSFNEHNALYSGVADVVMININPTCYGPGTNTNAGFGTPDTSVQCPTSHDNCIQVNLGGYFKDSMGGNNRFINASKTVEIGSTVDTDRGDLNNGGIEVPTLVQADNTAQVWLDAVRLKGPHSNIGLNALAGATIYIRNMGYNPKPVVSGGTISAW